MRILPRSLLFVLSQTLADLSFYLFFSIRKRSIKNLTSALGADLQGRETAVTVRKSLRNFFRAFVELGLALVVSPETICREISLVGREHLEAALEKGKGVIVLSAHLGNFFLLGTRLAIEGYPTHVLVKQHREGVLPRFMDHCRAKLKQKTIHARPRRKASEELVRALRRNHLTVVIADEYRSGSGVTVPFFGRAVLARRGPATLALRTGAAIVSAYLVRDLDGRLKLIIEPEMEFFRSGSIQVDIRENTRLMTQSLERIVRTYPDQWNWMNVHWRQASA